MLNFALMKVGLFIDTWYPMVDGVIKVVDNYARRLTNYCDVVVFCPDTGQVEKALPYQVEQCSSLPFFTNDYSVPLSALDPVFDARLIRSGIDLVHIHSPFTIGMAGLAYAKMNGLPVVATLHSQYRQDFEQNLHYLSQPWNISAHLQFLLSQYNCQHLVHLYLVHLN